MSAEEEIWAAIVAANRAWVSDDVDALADLFHQDAVLVLPGGRRLRGREAILRNYREYTRQIQTALFEELDHTVDVLGEIAVAAYRFRTRYEANGTNHEELGREILTLTRTSGRWSVVWRTKLPVSDRETVAQEN